MTIKNITYLGLLSVGLIFTTSCRKGCQDESALNYDDKAKKDDGSCLYDGDPPYIVPSTYAFEDSDGNSTVSFNGQQQRLEMLTEMSDLMKSLNVGLATVDADELRDMFENNGFTWIDADGLGMTGSTKQLKNKCANGDITITNLFEAYMDSIEANSNSIVPGSPGVAGAVLSNDGSKMYLQSAEGIEYGQLIEKGLMASVFYYQMTQVYFGSSKMDVDNSSAVDAVAGEYYTTMEHHWDEAYGYFTSEIDFPTNGTDRFWGKYANSREAILESATKIGDAFRLGRAAISNDDLGTRDDQIAIIRTEMERVLAATAIHYLNTAVSNITDDALRNHQLSEAFAFIDGIRYGYNPTMTDTEINLALATLGQNFYSISAADITATRDMISTFFDMDSIKASL